MSTGPRHLDCLKCGNPIFVDTDKEPQLCTACQASKKQSLSDAEMERFIKEQLQIMHRVFLSRNPRDSTPPEG